MKKILAVLLLATLAGCNPEDAAPASSSDNFDTSNATLVKQGTLVGIGHTASGVATLYERNGKKTVVLDPYSSQNGPDLKVYLSKDENATEYIRLGQLKAVMGKQAYDVPGTPNVSEYHYVHIWCEKYTVVFARAEIK